MRSTRYISGISTQARQQLRLICCCLLVLRSGWASAIVVTDANFCNLLLHQRAVSTRIANNDARHPPVLLLAVHCVVHTWGTPVHKRGTLHRGPFRPEPPRCSSLQGHNSSSSGNSPGRAKTHACIRRQSFCCCIFTNLPPQYTA